EVLGLRILAGFKLDLVELGDSVDHIGNGLAERGLDLGLGDVGVLHNVVEERCGESLRIKPPLRQDAGYRQRMSNIRFAGFSKLPLMRLFGKGERALDQCDVRRWQIVAKMSGEFGNFRHVLAIPPKGLLVADRQTVLCGLSNISMPTYPAATSRRAMTV